ncbi:hypothetical protein C8J56DRAFT_910411 [Mycena floridula]|nr:hypothetical protein C8J56DRAFT_910411 [Mycena floridula]
MPFIDDANPSILYSSGIGDWFTGGIEGEFRFTTHGSGQQNARATITFEGTAIAVYGSVKSVANSDSGTQGPVSTYTIDGGALATYTGVPGTSDTHQLRFFASGPLSEGNHTLTVENALTGPILILDYLEYTLLSTSDLAVTTTVFLNLPSSTGIASTSSCSLPSGKQVPLDTTIGAVLGSAALTLLVCIATMYYIFRHMKERASFSAPIRPFVHLGPSYTLPTSPESSSTFYQGDRLPALNLNPPPYSHSGVVSNKSASRAMDGVE